MSPPVPGLKRLTEAKPQSREEARAASLLSRVASPAPLAPSTQARHLEALRAREGRSRFRLPAPVAVTGLFVTSLAFGAATQPAVRAWVRGTIEQWRVTPEAPKAAAAAKPERAAPVKAEPVAVAPVVAAEPAPVEVAAKPEVASAEVKVANARVVPAAAPSARLAVPTGKLADAPAVEPKAVAAAPSALPPPSAPPLVSAEQLAAGAAAKEATPDIPDSAHRVDPSLLTGVAKVEALLKQGQAPQALEELDALPDDEETPQLLVVRGEVLAQVLRCREAIVYFSKVLAMKNVEAKWVERSLYARAACYAALGDGISSHADIDTYVEKFPNGRYKNWADKKHRH